MPPKAAYFPSLALGVNTRDNPSRLLRGQGQDGQNVDLFKGTALKRPGITRFNTTELNSGADILGMAEWSDRTAGATIRFVHAGSKFVTLNGSGVATNLLTTGINTTRPTGLAVARNFLGIANGGSDGAGKNYLFDGTNIQELLGDAPSGTVTLTDGGAGGNLDDGAIYKYKFTLFSSANSFETAVSAEFTVDLTAGQTKVSVDFPSGYTDALGTIWDKIRCYRTVGGGSAFFFHSNATADFTDNTADSSLGAAFADPGTAKPPACQIAVHFHDRLWLAGAINTNRNKIYPSRPGNIGTFFSTEVQTIEDPDEITCLVEYADMLWIATRKHWYVLRDATRSAGDFVLRNRVTDYGCLNPFCAVEIEGYLWFYDPARGVCRMDAAGNAQPVSLEILPSLTTDVEPDEERMFVMLHNERRHQLWVSVALDAGTENSKTWSAQYDRWHQVEGIPYPQPAWMPLDLEIAYGAIWTDTGDSRRNLAIGDYDGFVHFCNRTVRQDRTSSDVANGTATGGSTTTLTDTGAAFPTAASALKGVYVMVKDVSAGTFTKAKITSNTATELTFANIGFTVASGDLYWIGPIDAYLKLNDDAMDNPLVQKRVTKVTFTHATETHTNQTLEVNRYADGGAAVALQGSPTKLDDAATGSRKGRKVMQVAAVAEEVAIEFRARGSRDDFEIFDLGIWNEAQPTS